MACSDASSIFTRPENFALEKAFQCGQIDAIRAVQQLPGYVEQVIQEGIVE